MTDDPLSKFTARYAPKPPTASASRPPAGPALVVNHGADNREPYEAFDNKVATPYVEMRCNRTGISTFVLYSHMGAITFNFRTGGEVLFTSAGHAVTVSGRNLRDIVLALRLHTCNFIQDFSAGSHIEPHDPNAPFVETITVEILRPPPRPGEAGCSQPRPDDPNQR